MSLYQCFFFTNGYIGNFENIECDTTASLRRLFGEMLSEGAWEAVEGWKNDKLVCRVERSAEGRIGCSSDCPARNLAAPLSGTRRRHAERLAAWRRS